MLKQVVMFRMDPDHPQEPIKNHNLSYEHMVNVVF